MPTQESYRKVAEALKDQLGRKTFVTLERKEITELLRQVSGESNTRIKVLGSQAIMDELDELGLTTYPHLYDVGQNESLRVLRKDSFLVDLLGILNHPSEETDAKLRAALRTTKNGTVPEPEAVPA